VTPCVYSSPSSFLVPTLVWKTKRLERSDDGIGKAKTARFGFE
jgi:hypothetical protein